MKLITETALITNAYNTEPKTVFILLTKYTDVFSKTMNIIMGGKYTHASIGLSEDKMTFFSFNTKHGFCVETPAKKKRQNQCGLYQLSVSEQSYTIIKARIWDFKCNAEQYKYSFFGVFLCLMGIPIKRKNRYFCSQFVSELLALSGAVKLKKKPVLYLPKHFIKEPQLKLRYQGRLCGLAEGS